MIHVRLCENSDVAKLFPICVLEYCLLAIMDLGGGNKVFVGEAPPVTFSIYSHDKFGSYIG